MEPQPPPPAEEAKINMDKKIELTEGEFNYLNTHAELVEWLINRGFTPESAKENADSVFKLKEKPVKLKKVIVHSEIENVVHKVLKTRKLKDNGISIIRKDDEASEVNIWESKDVQYIVKVADLLKLQGQPKVYVSQIKNLSLLLGMVQEQQFNNFEKEAKCEFDFTYYAERRGYKKEEINGKMLDELKRDLLTGAYTTYKIDKIMIEGILYRAHGIPNFYTLYEPMKTGYNWKIEFNNPYSKWILEILSGEAKQFFIKDFKAIEDRTTSEKPYLFLFYQQLIKRKRTNLISVPVKVLSLLQDMQIDKQKLDRPKECFELLRECLIYFSEHYHPAPEIEQFFIYNDFNKTKTVKLPLFISEAFKQYPYEDFKEDLNDIGIKDIREAFISFKRPYIKPEAKFIEFVLTEEDKKLIEEILIWAGDWEEYTDKISFTREKKYKFLSDCIRYLGHEKLEISWTAEQGRENPSQSGKYHADDPIGYFTKRLPELLKADKAKKGID